METPLTGDGETLSSKLAGASLVGRRALWEAQITGEPEALERSCDSVARLTHNGDMAGVVAHVDRYARERAEAVSRQVRTRVSS